MYSTPQDPAVVLIVDEDPLNLMGIAATLDIMGYECHCAQDAEAATKAVRSLNLDLIICDASVAGQRGAELCQELLSEPGKEETPVLFISNGPLPDMARRKQDMGATYCLRKPIDPDVLIELVGKALWMPHLVKARASQAESLNSARLAKHPNHDPQTKHRHEDTARAPRGVLNTD